MSSNQVIIICLSLVVFKNSAGAAILEYLDNYRAFNTSIVAWQKTQNGVSSLGVVLPATGTPSRTLDLERGGRTNPHRILEQVAHLTKGRQCLEIYAEERTVDQRIKNRFFWDRDTTYYQHDGLVTFNKTLTVSREHLEAFKLRLNETELDLEPMVLHYGTNGILDLARSSITGPSIVAYVVDFWEASDQIIVDSPRILKDVVLGFNSEEVPRRLVEEFDRKFGEYDWRVVVNPGRFELVRDVWIRLSTDVFDFYDGRKDVYLVYGVKKIKGS